jgi:hypothetical protein
VRIYKEKGLAEFAFKKIHLNTFILRVFIEKTGCLRQPPNGGVDHLPLWIEIIILNRPFTINVDIKIPSPFGLI